MASNTVISGHRQEAPKYLNYIVLVLAFLIPVMQVMRLQLSALLRLPMQSFAFIPIAALAVIGLLLE